MRTTPPETYFPIDRIVDRNSNNAQNSEVNGEILQSIDKRRGARSRSTSRTCRCAPCCLLIAEESNLNVVAADTVQGNVTLRLVQHVPWDQALDLVLQARASTSARAVMSCGSRRSGIAKYEQDKAEAPGQTREQRRDGHRVHPDQLWQCRDIAKLLTDDAKNSRAVVIRWISAGSCRRVAASASTAAPIRCW